MLTPWLPSKPNSALRAAARRIPTAGASATMAHVLSREGWLDRAARKHLPGRLPGRRGRLQRGARAPARRRHLGCWSSCTATASCTSPDGPCPAAEASTWFRSQRGMGRDPRPPSNKSGPRCPNHPRATATPPRRPPAPTVRPTRPSAPVRWSLFDRQGVLPLIGHPNCLQALTGDVVKDRG